MGSMGKSHSLGNSCLGGFLNFSPMGESAPKITERRFRSYWDQTESGNERYPVHSGARAHQGPMRGASGGWFPSGKLSGGRLGNEKCTTHNATRKATMAAPI